MFIYQNITIHYNENQTELVPLSLLFLNKFNKQQNVTHTEKQRNNKSHVEISKLVFLKLFQSKSLLSV